MPQEDGEGKTEPSPLEEALAVRNLDLTNSQQFL